MKNGKFLTLSALIGLSASLNAVQTNADVRSEDVKSSIAKEMLYGSVERRGYSWGAPTNPDKDTSSSAKDNTSGKPESSDWAIAASTRTVQQSETTALAEQSSYKWGIRSDSDQSSYKWGIRSDSDQSSYKWGIR